MTSSSATVAFVVILAPLTGITDLFTSVVRAATSTRRFIGSFFLSPVDPDHYIS